MSKLDPKTVQMIAGCFPDVIRERAPHEVVDRAGRVWTRSVSGKYRRLTGSGVVATICDDESLPRRLAEGLITLPGDLT